MGISSAYFGTTNGIDELTVATSGETISLMDGLSEVTHQRTKMKTLTATNELCDSYGIAPSDATTNSFDQIVTAASYQLTEVTSNPCETTDPAMIAGNGFAAPDGTRVLTRYTSHIWLAIEERITLSFRYRGPGNGTSLFSRLLHQGNRIPDAFVIGPAATSDTYSPTSNPPYSMTAPTWPFIDVAANATPTDFAASFVVDSVSLKQSDKDWHTADVTLLRKRGLPSNLTGQSPLKRLLTLFGDTAGTLSVFEASKMPASAWTGETPQTTSVFKCTINFSLTQSGPATITETVEIYPTNTNDEMLDLSIQ